MDRLLTTEMIGFHRWQIKKLLGRFKIYDAIPDCPTYANLVGIPGVSALYDLEGCRVDFTEKHFLREAALATENEIAKLDAARSIWSPPKIDIAAVIAGARVEKRRTLYLGNYSNTMVIS